MLRSKTCDHHRRGARQTRTADESTVKDTSYCDLKKSGVAFPAELVLRRVEGAVEVGQIGRDVVAAEQRAR
jgi:hypothetical protein